MTVLRKSHRRIANKVATAVFLILTCSVFDLASAQQPGDWQGMLNRINRLQEQLYDIRDGQRGATQLQGSQGGIASPVTEAELSLRMDNVEQQMRGLTGQIEQMSFQLQQLTEQLNRFSKDVDFRFQQLGSKKRSGVNQPSSGVNQTASVGTIQPSSSGSGSGSLLDPNLAATVQSLGTLSGSSQQGSSTVPQAVASIPVEGSSPKELYQQSYGQLLQRQFEPAELGFKQFLRKHPKHKLAGNAQYWLGETYYARRRWTSAAKAFLKGYRTYSRSVKAPDSLVKLGMTLNKMGEKKKGCATLAQARKQFPKAKSVIKIAKRERARAGC